MAAPAISPGSAMKQSIEHGTKPTEKPVTPPLGLPPGSVRALLMIMLTMTVWYLVVLERIVPEYLADTAFLAIVFYFGERSVSEGTSTTRRQPLFMPRGVVRGAVVVGFFIIYAYQWLSGRQIPPFLTSIVDILAGYTAGVAVSLAIRASSRNAKPGILSAFGHARALFTLLGVGILCAIAITGRDAMVPPVFLTILDLMVAFYFGSRAVH